MSGSEIRKQLTADLNSRFPRWQFRDQGPLPDLTEFLNQIRKEIAPFTINRLPSSPQGIGLPQGEILRRS
ncbi:hypothetical protein DET61_1395 [Marinobacter nauticus]|uniref:Uncharacterized protein n=1 Tax=Marinobacter nauticus TaxID=2743 RepID=A0A368X297_MARNT|nr:hypothetical protein DET61_1395 [Marinobacter nauticus]